MSIVAFLLVAALTVIGCQPAQTLKPISPELGRCKKLFAERIQNALAGVDPFLTRERILNEVIAHLPNEESNIFAEARRAAIMQVDNLPQKTRVLVMESILDGFHRANFCGNNDGMSEMYVFADELNLYLSSLGIDTNLVFDRHGTFADDYVLNRVLLSLTTGE